MTYNISNENCKCWERFSLITYICMNEKALLPWMPSALTGIAVGHCVRPSVRPSVLPFVRPERQSRCNSSRISAIRLKFSGMMHSTMEQIAIKNGRACSTELWKMPWKAFLTRSERRRSRSNSLRISPISLQFGEMMQSTMEQISILNIYIFVFIYTSKMAMLVHFLHIPPKFEIFHDRLFWETIIPL